MLERLFLSFSPFLVFTVVGKSMDPTFIEGEKILAVKFLTLKKGDVVVLKDPRNERLLVKRIIQINKEEFFIEGDNKKESTDSRHFGWISRKSVIGKVIYPKVR